MDVVVADTVALAARATGARAARRERPFLDLGVCRRLEIVDGLDLVGVGRLWVEARDRLREGAAFGEAAREIGPRCGLGLGRLPDLRVDGARRRVAAAVADRAAKLRVFRARIGECKCRYRTGRLGERDDLAAIEERGVVHRVVVGLHPVVAHAAAAEADFVQLAVHGAVARARGAAEGKVRRTVERLLAVAGVQRASPFLRAAVVVDRVGRLRPDDVDLAPDAARGGVHVDRRRLAVQRTGGIDAHRLERAVIVRAAGVELRTPRGVLVIRLAADQVAVVGAAARTDPERSREGLVRPGRREGIDCRALVRVREAHEDAAVGVRGAALGRDPARAADAARRLGARVGVRHARQGVRRRVGHGLDAVTALAEVPDARVVGPGAGTAVDCGTALGRAVPHRELGAVHHARESDPDERLAGSVPGVDFVRDGVAGRVEEAEVRARHVAGVVEVGVGEAGRRVVGEADEDREVRELLRARVARHSKLHATRELRHGRVGPVEVYASLKRAGRDARQRGGVGGHEVPVVRAVRERG